MSKILRAFLPIALATVAPLPALAADYEPPIFVEDVDEYVPVEVGNGWYLRGDLGYKFNESFNDFTFAVLPGFNFSRYETPLTGSLGVGYRVNDFFRLEVNVGRFANSRTRLGFDTLTPSSVDMVARNTIWTGMVNAYADLGTFVGFTPFIGGGIGVAASERRFRMTETFGNPALDTTIIDNDTQYSFAYSLGAGVNYKVTRNLSVDVGYEYFSAPNAEFVSISGPGTFAVRDGVDAHQVKIGMRYDLW